MTVEALIFVVLMLTAAAVANRLGSQMRREMQVTNPRRRQQLRLQESLEGPSDPYDIAALPVVELGGGELSQHGDRPPAREVLGYPAPLKPIYSLLRSLPEAEWEFQIKPIEIEAFDAPGGLIHASSECPLVEAPLYSFLKADEMNPGELLVLGQSFTAGTREHRPFAFVEQAGLGKHPPITDPRSLLGKAICVLGKFMSPTIVLLETLSEFDLECRLWEPESWPDREPTAGRVDVLVGGSFDGQRSSLKTRQVDYALVIYPYTHDPRLTDRNRNDLRPVNIELMDKLMADALSNRLLNVSVTCAAWYRSDPQWRRSADRLYEAVRRKNAVLEREAMTISAHGIASPASAALESGEIRFGGGPEADVDAMLTLASVGNKVGLLQEPVDLARARQWIKDLRCS